MRITHLISALIIAAITTACSKPTIVEVTIENNLNFPRTHELVELPLTELSKKIKWDSKVGLIVLNDKGKEVTSQITTEGLLVFESQLKANSTQIFTIKEGTTSNYPPLVECKYRPERKQDFSWENNRVGFRFYGQELQKQDGPSNGLDLFYKRTDQLILDKWYKNDIAQIASYHVDHGEGCDPYAVGRTLGAGAAALYHNGKAILNSNYVNYEIIDNGPLRATFILTYPDLHINNKQITERKRITLDAHSQLTKIEQMYGVDETATVTVGLVKRLNQKDSTLLSEDRQTLFYQEPTDPTNETIFLSLTFPTAIDSIKVDKYSLPGNKRVLANTLAFTTIQPNQSLSYYTGFGWTKYGFKTLEEYQRYIARFTEAQNNPFIIKYKTK